MNIGLTSMDLELAFARLIAIRPFYGYLLSRFQRRHDPSLQGGLGYRFHATGQPLLLWNGASMITPLDGSQDLEGAASIRAWTDSELDAVLEHVCLHVLHKHHDRRGQHSLAKWGLACDLAINGLTVGLPSTAVLPGDLDLASDLTAEAYAQLLAHEEGCAACGRPPPVPGPTESQESDEEGDQADGPQQDGDDAGQDGTDAASDQEQRDGAQENDCPACSFSPVDDHAPWDAEDNAPPEITNSIVQRIVEHAASRAASRGKGIGDLPGHVKSLIDGILAGPPQHWGSKLRRFTQGNRRAGRRSTMMRRNRRYGAFFAGKRRSRVGKVVIIADTSASVDRDGLAQEWAEMRAIARQSDAVVMEVDARIQDIYALTPTSPIPAFKGRGGTRFRQALELVADPYMADVHPKQSLLRGAEAVILLTDGGVNDLPMECPVDLPVLWAILPGGVVPYDWGDAIHLHSTNDDS